MSWFVVGEDGEELVVTEANERKDIDDGFTRINGPFESKEEATTRVVKREIAAENDTGEFDGD